MGSRRLDGVDGELRAENFTVMAIRAFIGLDDIRGMIPLHIESRGKFENPRGAEFNTVSASLATIFNDMNDPLRDLYLIRIKRNPPEFHCPISPS